MARNDEWSHCGAKMSAEVNQDDASNERHRNPSNSVLIGKLEGSRDEDHREQDQRYWITDSAILVQWVGQHEKKHQRQQQEQRVTVLSRSFHRFLPGQRRGLDCTSWEWRSDIAVLRCEHARRQTALAGTDSGGTRIPRHAQNRLFFPDSEPLRRELYVKHMEFFEAGSNHNERLFLGGNRVGKSEGVGAYECVLHLTRNYPAWRRGRRFSHPVAVWAAGKDAKTTRDILQLALLVPGPQFGRGMIPADLILGTTPKPGVPEGVETIYVRHISGGRSEVQLKSFDSGVESFYGTKKHVVWIDEECEPGIYSEVLMRTLSTVPGEPNGI